PSPLGSRRCSRATASPSSRSVQAISPVRTASRPTLPATASLPRVSERKSAMPTSAPPSEDMMRVTQDVVRDLLPLYFENEASPDSRILVETWFAHDPAFA